MAHKGPDKGKGKGGGRHEKHVHDYQAVRQEVKQEGGKTVFYVFLECRNTKGTCNQRDKMEIHRK